MLENISYLVAIISAICGATFFISKKLVCSERASDKALETCTELEKLIDKETKHSDEIHSKLFDKIDEIKNILLKNK
mgnify:CR=1 FL=1|tara:strand:+ start:842 stop:1072 length:231 start_codon:yes stop_codon:yes gene_type:complete